MLSLWDLWQYLCLWWERLDHILVNPTCLLVVFILTYHLESVRNGCVIELFVTVFVLSLCVPWVLLTNCLESLNKSLEHSCRVLFFYKMTKFWYGFKISRRKQMNFRGKVFNEYNKLGGGGGLLRNSNKLLYTLSKFSRKQLGLSCFDTFCKQARQAQSAEHQTSDLRVVGWSPSVGKHFSFCILSLSTRSWQVDWCNANEIKHDVHPRYIGA